MSRALIVVFGGAFNPPGIHHQTIALAVQRFGEVVIYPCGDRPDKPDIARVSVQHRREMVQKTFGHLQGVLINDHDLVSNSYSRTWQLEERFCVHGKVWHVVGADLVVGGACGKSYIQQVWERGIEMFGSLSFLVIPRPGVYLTHADLPPQGKLIEECSISGASHVIRDRLASGQSITGLVTSEVEEYIQQHQLYQVTTVKP